MNFFLITTFLKPEASSSAFLYTHLSSKALALSSLLNRYGLFNSSDEKSNRQTRSERETAEGAVKR